MPNIDSDPRFIHPEPGSHLGWQIPTNVQYPVCRVKPLTFDSKGRLVYNHSWS
jgi:hypothetical protein